MTETSTQGNTPATTLKQTPVTNPSKTLERTLEQEAFDQGVNRYRKAREEAKGDHSESKTLPGVRLLKQAVDPVAIAIENFVRHESKRAGKYFGAVKLLRQVDAHVAAFLIAQEVLNGISKQHTLNNVSIRLGTLIEDEVRCRSFKSQNPALYGTIQRNFSPRSNYDHKRKVLLHSGNKAGIEWEPWSKTDRLHLGQRCVELFIQATGLVEVVHRHEQQKTRVYLEATAKTREWINKYDLIAEGLWPVYMPMVTPPNPWTSPVDGGYENGRLLHPRLVKSFNSNYAFELKHHDMPAVYRAVNAIQATAWRINKPLLTVMHHAWENGKSVGGLISSELEALPDKPLDIETNEEARREWRRAASKVHVRNAARTSKRLQGSFIVGLAEKFKSASSVYFPATLDFRSRVYLVPQFLNPQGAEHARALLEFAEGKALGNEGAYWLAIHGANCWGEDKLPMNDRVAWVQNNSEWILSCADDPLTFRQWEDADAPWMFLAFAFEWAGFIREGQSFVSHIPVSMDGSCNGLQHFSAILRDPVGGAAVNLIPSDRPSDIYQQVADVVSAKLVSRASAGDREALKWIDLVDRKICKRPTMTLVYGSTPYGVRQQVFEIVRQWNEEKRELPFAEDGWEESVYLGSVIWDSLGEVVSAARAAMAWLQNAAVLAASEDLPLHWFTPVEFPVLQEYRELKKRRVKTQLLGKFVYLTVQEAQDKLDRQQQANGIAPNWVHSLDAAHLMSSVNRCVDAGIKDFSMIHDSYGTHACNVGKMGVCLREAFIELHSVNRLEEFREKLLEQLTPENRLKLPPIPPSGSLDLEAVRQSRYFFA